MAAHEWFEFLKLPPLVLYAAPREVGAAKIYKSCLKGKFNLLASMDLKTG